MYITFDRIYTVFQEHLNCNQPSNLFENELVAECQLRIMSLCQRVGINTRFHR